MKRGRSIAYFILAAALCAAGNAHAATVDFETIADGTKFGTAYGSVPGDIVLAQDGIVVTVEEFFLGTFTGFIKAEAGGIYGDFFPTTPLELDNISARFDFGGVGFDVTSVQIEYRDFGGASNVAVNDLPVYELATLTDLPTQVAPGITSSFSGDFLTLTGSLESFQIGGQELVIDNIIAVPEPASVLLLGAGALLLLRRTRGRPSGR
jgi:hypothetical protein